MKIIVVANQKGGGVGKTTTSQALTAEESIQHMNGGYDIMPSNIMLAGAEQELSQTGKEHRLKETIVTIAGNYDYIIVDMPPSLGVLTVNAFTAASDILILTAVRMRLLDSISLTKP